MVVTQILKQPGKLRTQLNLKLNLNLNLCAGNIWEHHPAPRCQQAYSGWQADPSAGEHLPIRGLTRQGSRVTVGESRITVGDSTRQYGDSGTVQD